MRSILKAIINIFALTLLLILSGLSITMIILLNNASGALTNLRVGYTPTKIFDSNNNLIYTTKENYEYVNLEDISSNIINSFIAIEDETFYKHKGFNTKRIVSSLYNNLTKKSISGASTITQQYIKNAYLSSDKTLKRKLTEFAYAITLERNYTKNQIMEAYLNTILFGSNIYGINMACQNLFSKSPKEISINEGAYLAAIINAPNYFLTNIDKANERKNVVLKKLYECNMISYDDYYKNKELDITINYKNQTNNPIYNSYLDYLLPLIEDEPDEVYTYLDSSIQETLYDIINNEYKLFNDDSLNCSIVVLDNETYGIKAIAGNRNTNRMVLNYATDVKLQPGSTIKPILDYAPAIEYLNYTLSSIIVDEPYTYKDGTHVKNYDNGFLGNITIRKALSDSRNIPAIKLFNEVGYSKAFEFASKIGITSNEIYESDAIGGAKNGYTLLSLANAYQAFANLGYYKSSSPIKYIKKNESYVYNQEKPKVVMKPSTAFLINSVLHDVFKNSSYNLQNTYLMAKTGQTNYDEKTRKLYNIPANATKDSLIIAYTKDLTIGIWVGYDNLANETYLDRYKKNIPRSIMKILLDKYAKDNQYYELLPDIVEKNIEIVDNLVYLSDKGYNEYFVIGTEPLGYYNNQNKI